MCIRDRYTSGITDICSDEFEQHIRDFSIAVANQTKGALAVYLRYSPDFTGSGTDGFFWTRESDSEKFRETQVTDILAYNASDIRHVGWYYVPKESGKPLWMNPYYNDVIDLLIISYVIPMYLDSGEFIGVLGMDIDFAAVVSETNDMDIYSSGSVEFVDLKERISYSASNGGVIESSRLSNALYNHITTINKLNELLEIKNSNDTISAVSYTHLTLPTKA